MPPWYDGAVKNQEVADLIGVSAGAASRLRHGQRSPSLPTMEAIARAFDWPLSEQIVVKAAGQTHYARKFEARIQAHARTQA